MSLEKILFIIIFTAIWVIFIYRKSIKVRLSRNMRFISRPELKSNPYKAILRFIYNLLSGILVSYLIATIFGI